MQENSHTVLCGWQAVEHSTALSGWYGVANLYLEQMALAWDLEHEDKKIDKSEGSIRRVSRHQDRHMQRPGSDRAHLLLKNYKEFSAAESEARGMEI